MLGLCPGLLLRHMEQESGKPLHELFDLICGTSVGAVIAGVACTRKSSLDDALNQLKNTKMFKTSVWNNISTLFGLRRARVSPAVRDATMHTLYGDTRLSEGLVDILTVSYDLSKKGAKIFSSSKARKDPQREDVLITDAVRASASVPTIWEPLKVGDSICIDGGLFSNNPLLYGLSEAINHYKVDPSNCVVLSLGTGYLMYDDENEENKNGTVGRKNLVKKIATRGLKFLEEVVRAAVSTDTINTVALTATFLPRINQFVHIDFPLRWHQFQLLSTDESFVDGLETVAEKVIGESKEQLNVFSGYLTGAAPLGVAPGKDERGKFYSNVRSLTHLQR